MDNVWRGELRNRREDRAPHQWPVGIEQPSVRTCDVRAKHQQRIDRACGDDGCNDGTPCLQDPVQTLGVTTAGEDPDLQPNKRHRGSEVCCH